MIETLTSPVSVAQSTETIELDFGAIRFQRDDAGGIQLWEPRYDSLFDYGVTPDNIRFDPGFQILVDDAALLIKMKLEIQDEGARFADEGQGLQCFSIEAPGVLGKDVPGIFEVEWDPGNPRVCAVTWQQSLADQDRRRDVTVLRIACAATEPEADPVRSKVEGGVYVAIINKPRESASIEPLSGRKSNQKRIEIVGIDEHARPIYNVFKTGTAVDPRLELEPAFRAIEGERLQVNIALCLDPVHEFETTPDGREVAVLHHSPAVRSPQLRRTDAEEGATVCSVEWSQQTARNVCRVDLPDAKLSNCTQGFVASFFLRLKSLKGEARLPVDIDPTVIQPPVCNGDVCIPPIGYSDSGARS